MKRILCGNIYYQLNDNYYIMNLISFRRQKLSYNEILTLNSINKKLENYVSFTETEEKLYNYLLDKKQILSKELIDKFDQGLMQSVNHNFSVNIESISINLTYQCNYNCRYCYQKQYSDKSGVMTKNLINRIYNFLDFYIGNNCGQFKLKTLLISGGETLLEDNIPIINHILNRFGDKVEKFILYTNGTNILKYKKKIDYSRIKEYQVSLDGIDPVISKLNRYCKKAFHDIVNGIKLLAELGSKVSIITMLCQDTVKYLHDLINHLEAQNILSYDNVSMRVSNIMNNFKNSIIDEDFYTLNEYLELKDIAKKIIGNRNIVVDTLYGLSPLSSRILRANNARLGYRISRCNEINIPLLFGPNGKVYWCNCEDPKLGLIGEFFPEIALDIQSIKGFQSRNIFSIDKCKNCELRYICVGGCVLPNVAQKKAIFEPNCGVFENEFCMENLERFIF